MLSFVSDVRYTRRMAGIRERARAEVTAEIVRLAREQIAEHGPAALSLRAIARDLGMVSSAVYRYFPSRDDLLTRLIIDSYDRLGAVAEAADATCARDDLRGRWRTVAHAVRGWAVEHPSEYALLFGTPVPGYRAPTDTIGPASRYTLVLVGLLVDVEASGVTVDATVPPALHADLLRLRGNGPVPSDEMMQVGMGAWAAMMGAITLELFGHLHNVVDTPGALFDAVVEQQARLIVP